MQINTSQISMDASVDHKDVSERLGQRIRQQEGQEQQFRLNLPGMTDYRFERFEENRQSQEMKAASAVSCPGQEKTYLTESDQVMERMVEEVVGQGVRLRRIDGLEHRGSVFPSKPFNPPGEQILFSFASHSLHYEYERVSVNSAGTVQLSDGRSLNFSLELTMERESLVRESVAWQEAGRVLLDPLVLNFDCDLRGLSNRKFQFDLDCDGNADEVCSLQPGTGFLALDLNNDRKINDGRELFGPTSGHGFAELARHDRDNNGWIDENDPIFPKLRIWKQGGEGEPALITLAEAGVGAICLEHDKSTFQLKGRDNGLMGEVAANGLFLTEAGEVRPMQEIKFALKEAANNSSSLVREEKKSESQHILSQLVAIRQAEVQAMTRLRLSRRERQDEGDILTRLFAEWQKETGLASVQARRKNLS
ncbi:MAG: hypothetical protein KKH60_05130 [Proteobacteria bacterium]|nr:hypothetical protein [Pseudomonadota bacterium]